MQGAWVQSLVREDPTYPCKGAVVDTFLGSLVQSCCEEEGTLQTNNIGICSQCLSYTGFAPLVTCVLSLSTLLRL